LKNVAPKKNKNKISSNVGSVPDPKARELTISTVICKGSLVMATLQIFLGTEYVLLSFRIFRYSFK